MPTQGFTLILSQTHGWGLRTPPSAPTFKPVYSQRSAPSDCVNLLLATPHSASRLSLCDQLFHPGGLRLAQPWHSLSIARHCHMRYNSSPFLQTDCPCSAHDVSAILSSTYWPYARNFRHEDVQSSKDRGPKARSVFSNRLSSEPAAKGVF